MFIEPQAIGQCPCRLDEVGISRPDLAGSGPLVVVSSSRLALLDAQKVILLG